MVCIQCNEKTQVINSRLQKRLNTVWRRRNCPLGHTFTTHETIDYGAVWVVVSPQGRISSFSRDRLFLSLLASLQHRKTASTDAAALADTVIQKIGVQIVGTGRINASAIASAAQVALNRFDVAASVHYSAYHSRPI